MGTVGLVLEGYFPAYFPIAILLLKWATLWSAGVLNVAAWFADVGLTFVVFDIWAITTKFKGQTLRLDGSSPHGEGAILVTFLVVHLAGYVLNIRAWLAPEPAELPVKLLAIFVLVATGGSSLLVLGAPPKARRPE